jgi:hypothetical protein
MDEDDDLKAREEVKRERAWNPVKRWRVLQQTIAWVDSQQKVPRNSPAGCLAEERRKQVRLGADNTATE